jgi:hypothetical protein
LVVSVVQFGASLIANALQKPQQRAERGVSVGFDIAAQGDLLRRKVVCPTVNQVIFSGRRLVRPAQRLDASCNLLKRFELIWVV